MCDRRKGKREDSDDYPSYYYKCELGRQPQQMRRHTLKAVNAANMNPMLYPTVSHKAQEQLMSDTALKSVQEGKKSFVSATKSKNK